MKLLLIDGNSMLFRGYYATCYTNMMKTSSGVYTNAVYAFAVMLEKALQIIKPDYVAVALDKGKHTFRHELSSDYKGGRKETPEELIPQFAMVREFLDHYPIPYFEFDEIEADDIIGSLSKKYPDLETCIFSSDKDLLQLIDPTTSVYLMKKGMTDIVKMDEEALFKEYELEPIQIRDLKGLMGDTSDNIKGVKGIGPKTAIKLLKDYKTCEGIYEHLDELKGKVKENLENDKDSCFLSKQLATIKTDVEIDLPLEDLKFKLDQDLLNDFYKRYEMFSLVRSQKAEVKKVEAIKPVKKISKDFFDKAPYIHFESNHFSYYEADCIGLAFSDGSQSEFILLEDLKKDEETLAFLKSDLKKVIYDYKAVKHGLKYHGIALDGDIDDLMFMGFLNYNYNDSLEAIFTYYKKPQFVSVTERYGTLKKPIKLDQDFIIQNAIEIAFNASNIYKEAMAELKEKELLDLYSKVELPLSAVLFEMEENGIVCDETILDEIANDTFNKMNLIADEIYGLVNHSFNLNSPKQLAEVLFDELGLPDRKKRSTSVEVLSKLTNYHPVISLIMEYRKYSKLYSTYAEGLKKYIKEDGKIHTIFSQTITQTGRLSSYDPNLQNISVKDEEGRLIRKAFKPSKDCILISSDYSQIELRVLASLSNEDKMLEAFNNHIDIHTKTAIDVFGMNEDEVDAKVRRQAKAVNFGVVYGISDFGLSQQASLSIKEAKAFIEEYFKTYPKIKEYMENQIKFCSEHGYVKTMMNRRRYIKEINDRNFMIKEFGKRAAMNSPIQGSAADLIKMAMVLINQMMKDKKVQSKLILQVHDELIFDVLNEEVEIMTNIIKEGMLNAAKLNVLLESSLAFGQSWYEAK